MRFILKDSLVNALRDTAYLLPIVVETQATIKANYEKRQEQIYPVGYEALRKPFDIQNGNCDLYSIDIDSRFVTIADGKVKGIQGISNFGDIHVYKTLSDKTEKQESQIGRYVRPESCAIVNLVLFDRIARLSGVSRRIQDKHGNRISDTVVFNLLDKSKLRLVTTDKTGKRIELKALVDTDIV